MSSLQKGSCCPSNEFQRILLSAVQTKSSILDGEPLHAAYLHDDINMLIHILSDTAHVAYALVYCSLKNCTSLFLADAICTHSFPS